MINDFSFLETLPDAHLRNGYIEAIKVALIRDASFFEWIETNVEALNSFDRDTLHALIHRWRWTTMWLTLLLLAIPSRWDQFDL